MHEILERLDRMEWKLDFLYDKIKEGITLSNIIIRKENIQMADFTALNARVAKLTSVTESIKTMNDGLKAERDALKAELETLKAADQLDQGAVDAAEAELATVNTVLDAIAAVASNTGGSMRDVPV